MYYWFLAVFSFFLLILLTPKRFKAIVWAVWAFFIAFRYKIGPDYIQYEFTHNEILKGNSFFIERSEFFHIQITEFVESIGGSFQLVVLIYTIITIIFFYLGFKYYSKNTYLWETLLLLFFLAFMLFPLINGLRQVLAVAVFLYASRYIIQRKLLLYILFVAPLFLVHTSSIILLPLYWLANIRFSKRGIILYFFIISAFIFINPITYLEVLYSRFNLPYSEYLNYGRFSKPPNLSVKLMTFLSLLTLFGIKLLDQQDAKENLIINIALYSAMLKVLTINMLIIGRLSYYFKPFSLIFMLYIFFKIFQRAKTKEVFFVITCFILFLIPLAQLWSISTSESAYRQFSLNLQLFNKPDPVQIFGDHNEAKKWEK